MNVLMIVNGPPYGSELPFNALRLADGYYHLDRMVSSVLRKGAEVGCCGTCLDARGIADDQLVDGARRSTMDELTDWTLEAERIITF